MSRVRVRSVVGGLSLLGVGVSAGVGAVRRRREERAANGVPERHGLAATDVTLRSPGGTDLHGYWIAPTFASPPDAPHAPTSASPSVAPHDGPHAPIPASPATTPRDAPRAAGPAVLVVHGYASHAGDLLPVARWLVDAGFRVLVLSVRGHGRSAPTPERPSPPSFAEDIHAGVAWLHARPDVTTVGLVGHSMGGSAAIIAASERDDLGAVVTVGAVADPTLTNLGWWPATFNRLLIPWVARRTGRDPRPGFARNRIADVSAPLLLVHGARDRVIPVRQARALVDAAPHVPVMFVRGAGHTSLEAYAPAVDPVVGFLTRHLTAPSPPRKPATRSAP